MHHGLLRLCLISLAASVCSLIIVLGSNTANTVVAADDPPPLREIVGGIKQAHTSLLKISGGLGLYYRIDVEQDEKNPGFIWMKGLDGLVNIKWPVVKSRIEGEMFSFVGKEKRLTSEKTVREANYSFEANRSVAREGTALGQLTNYRHSFSANTAFPLNFQYYAEMDQFYNPGERLKTERLLPDVLEQHDYQRLADEDVGGTTCAVLKRGTLDMIWIAVSKSHIICKREQRVASGGVYERMLSTDIREVAPGVWFPYEQNEEVFNPGQPGTPRVFKLTLRIIKVASPISDEDTKIVLGKDIRRIEDSTTNKTYYPEQTAEKRDYALRQAVNGAQVYSKGTGSWVRFSLIVFNTLLGVGIIYLVYSRLRKRKKTVHPPSETDDNATKNR